MAISNNIYYVENITDPTSVPVLFIHGAAGNSLSWPPQIRSQRGQRLYVLDLPGHGRSSGSSLRSIEEMGNCIIEFMNSIKLNRAVLIGHSMGGAIAQWLAIHHPRKVLGLGLISTAASIQVDPTYLIDDSKQASFELLARKLIDDSFSNSIPPRTKDLAYQRLLELRTTVFHNDFFACSRFNLGNEVSKIKAPTLIICGDEDKMIHPSHSHRLNKLISGSELNIFPNAGHMLLLEKPNEISELIFSFIQTIKWHPGSN